MQYFALNVKFVYIGFHVNEQRSKCHADENYERNLRTTESSTSKMGYKNEITEYTAGKQKQKSQRSVNTEQNRVVRQIL